MSLENEFCVPFRKKVIYRDPEYDMAELDVVGEAVVASKDWPGDERSQQYVTSIIGVELNGALDKQAEQKVSYQELYNNAGQICEAIAAVLQGRGFTVSKLSIDLIAPTASFQNFIRIKEQQKMMQSLTPEDIAKKLQEAQREAEAAVAGMTEEERQQAMIRAQQMAEQEQAKIQAALEMSRKMREAAANPTPGPMPTQPMAPAAGELKIPNFCPKCGRPSGGYRFCGGCGNRLA